VLLERRVWQTAPTGIIAITPTQVDFGRP